MGSDGNLLPKKKWWIGTVEILKNFPIILGVPMTPCQNLWSSFRREQISPQFTKSPHNWLIKNKRISQYCTIDILIRFFWSTRALLCTDQTDFAVKGLNLSGLFDWDWFLFTQSDNKIPIITMKYEIIGMTFEKTEWNQLNRTRSPQQRFAKNFTTCLFFEYNFFIDNSLISQYFLISFQISILISNKTKVIDRRMCVKISPDTATVFGVFRRSPRRRAWMDRQRGTMEMLSPKDRLQWPQVLTEQHSSNRQIFWMIPVQLKMRQSICKHCPQYPVVRRVQVHRLYWNHPAVRRWMMVNNWCERPRQMAINHPHVFQLLRRQRKIGPAVWKFPNCQKSTVAMMQVRVVNARMTN